MDWLSHQIKIKYRKFWKYFNRITKVPGLLWIILMSIPVFFIAFTHIRPKLTNIFTEMKNIEFEDRNKGYLIKTVGCKIPDLPVFSSDMAKYFEYEFDGAHCNKDLPPLVQSNLTSLFLDKDSLLKYNVSNLDLFYCCYKELKRKIPVGRPDSQYEFSSVCSKFEKTVEIKEEFVLVECIYDNEKIYKDLFAFIPPKHDVALLDKNRKQFNILIIGIDGISRLNFHRQMNKTVKFLKQLISQNS
ncbi:hypothetical protein WA026_007585 [Henosepilachna vigintioctopunctata]|uniref:Uncharacterized protein n=1 Tax=Henosepilachna vigintioctopunctata TaxID=420089 RepID=A0AAW1UQB4_9CUCU